MGDLGGLVVAFGGSVLPTLILNRMLYTCMHVQCIQKLLNDHTFLTGLHFCPFSQLL